MELVCQQHPALIFVSAHSGQIVRKARVLGVEVEDFRQEVLLFILEQGHKYDPARGSFVAFVLGSVERIVRSQVIGGHRYALSLDADDASGEVLRTGLEAMETVIDEDPYAQSSSTQVPGAANLVKIAELISGMSASEIASARKITKRRINQILKRTRDEARSQFALDFAGEGVA